MTLSHQRLFPSKLNDYYPVSNKESAVRFVNVGGRSSEQRGEIRESGELIPVTFTIADPSSGSYRNEAEASEILDLLKTLLCQKEKDSYKGSIGIVTPYSSQVSLIKSMIAQDEEVREMVQAFPHEIEVKTVE